MIDDLIANVEGAKTAGMKGLLFTTSQQTASEIRSSFELPSVQEK